MSRRGFPQAAAGIVFAGTLLLSSCATAVPAGDAPPSGGEDVLVGTSWVLDKMGDQQVTDVTSTLQFTAEGMVSGSGGCNRFNGEFTEDGDVLTIGVVGTTMMACEPLVSDQEDAFLTALGDAKRFTVDGDKLSLSDEEGADLLLFTAQSQELAGTAWTVTGYNNGREAVVSVLEGTTAEVAFGEDGSISGTGGCNRLMGSFIDEDGSLTVQTTSMTKMMCAEPEGVMEQEAELIDALESTTGYVMEGNELRLSASDDATAMTLTRG